MTKRHEYGSDAVLGNYLRKDEYWQSHEEATMRFNVAQKGQILATDDMTIMVETIVSGNQESREITTIRRQRNSNAEPDRCVRLNTW